VFGAGVFCFGWVFWRVGVVCAAGGVGAVLEVFGCRWGCFLFFFFGVAFVLVGCVGHHTPA